MQPVAHSLTCALRFLVAATHAMPAVSSVCKSQKRHLHCARVLERLSYIKRWANIA
jgi:hypothetical protein